MSLNRCSRTTLLVVAVVALVATAGLAGALSFEQSVPEESEVGTTATASVEVTDLYDDHAEWQIAATTELEDPEWTAELYSDGDLLEERSNADDTLDPIELDEDASDAPDEIRVEVEGEVPAVEEWSYEDGQPIAAIELVGHDGESEFDVQRWSTDRFTTGDPGSAEAASALDDTRDAIDAASDDGEDVAEAEDLFDDAVAHYDDGEFADAVETAEEAEALVADEADDDADDGASDGDADESEADDESEVDESEADDEDDAAASADEDGGSGLLTLVFYALGIVALIAVVGGVLYRRQQQNAPSRDPLG